MAARSYACVNSMRGASRAGSRTSPVRVPAAAPCAIRSVQGRAASQVRPRVRSAPLAQQDGEVQRARLPALSGDIGPSAAPVILNGYEVSCPRTMLTTTATPVSSRSSVRFLILSWTYLDHLDA